MTEFIPETTFSPTSMTELPTAVISARTHTAAGALDTAYEMAMLAAAAADERKGGDILLLKVGDVSVLADYFVLVSGYSKVQVRAIARAIEDKIAETLQRNPLRSEGLADGSWVLQDYGDVIIHVLMPSERDYYNLEAFWGHAECIPYQPEAN